MKFKNREERVLGYMRKYQTITQMEALKHCSTMRLSAVIYNLKKQGYAINTESVRVRTAVGWAYVAQYSLCRKGKK